MGFGGRPRGTTLGLAFAAEGLNIALFDATAKQLQVELGGMPFAAAGADEVLRLVMGTRFPAATDSGVVATAETSSSGSGEPSAECELVAGMSGDLWDGRLLVPQSIVCPETTVPVDATIASLRKSIDVAFCPERDTAASSRPARTRRPDHSARHCVERAGECSSRTVQHGACLQ